MANNPNASDNLRPFPKGVSGNPNGRPRSLAKMVKEMPIEAQTEIYGVLYHAISLRNENEARTYLEQMNQDTRMGKYGIVLQMAIKALTGPRGWETLMDILDRLFGKRRLQVEEQRQSHDTVIVISEIAKKAGDKWSSKPFNEIGPGDTVVPLELPPDAKAGLQKALETGAKPREPRVHPGDTVLWVDNQDQADKLMNIGEIG